jgi:hypothetical protein
VHTGRPRCFPHRIRSRSRRRRSRSRASAKASASAGRSRTRLSPAQLRLTLVGNSGERSGEGRRCGCSAARPPLARLRGRARRQRGQSCSRRSQLKVQSAPRHGEAE